MNLKKKTGIVLMLLCMAAILAITWYCLFAVARGRSYMDGTFVESIQTEEMRLAA